MHKREITCNFDLKTPFNNGVHFILFTILLSSWPSAAGPPDYPDPPQDDQEVGDHDRRQHEVYRQVDEAVREEHEGDHITLNCK